MTDISSNLDRVIEKLDGMTSEVVAKNYGMDIASKIEHISKQLDYVQSGDSGGGSSGNDDSGNSSNTRMVIHVPISSVNSARGVFDSDKTFYEINNHLLNGGDAVISVDGVNSDDEIIHSFYNLVNYAEGVRIHFSNITPTKSNDTLAIIKYEYIFTPTSKHYITTTY